MAGVRGSASTSLPRGSRRGQLVQRLRRRASGAPLLTLAATAIGYALLARAGQQLTDAGSGVASFWPPNGLIVGLLVLVRPGLRTWVVAAVLPGELAADAMQGYPILAALGWGAANVVESMLAASLLLLLARRRPSGDRQRDFVALGVAAIVAPAAGALIGAAVSEATYGGGYFLAWRTWWLGDATGMLLVVPLVLSYAHAHPRRGPLRRALGLANFALVVSAAVAVFAFTTTPVEFLVLPPVVLLAVRENLRLVAFASVSFSVAATILTGRGHGPLSDFSGLELRILVLQAFLTTTAFVAFIISAAISERSAAEAALTDLATRDPLTGLPNRRLFLAQFDRLAARASRSPGTAAILTFDLDGFKHVNDMLGHAAGDAVLVEVGARLSAALRPSDLAARLGGDEFAALLDPVDGLEAAESAAERIAALIGQPVRFGDTFIPVGVSAGAALVDAGRASLAAADAELYRRKAAAPAVRAASRGVSVEAAEIELWQAF